MTYKITLLIAATVALCSTSWNGTRERPVEPGSENISLEPSPKSMLTMPALRFESPPVLNKTVRSKTDSIHPSDAVESKLTLGVHVAEIGPALSQHLGLSKRIGLLVEHVVVGSAAETAGIKKHDVLHKLNDQLLVNREQMAVLLAALTATPEVEITLVHDGRSIVVSALLKLEDMGAKNGPNTDFDAFHYFHGEGGHVEFQNCSVCHAGSVDEILKAADFDNYEFFHGKRGSRESQDCSACHKRNVYPLEIKKAT